MVTRRVATGDELSSQILVILYNGSSIPEFIKGLEWFRKHARSQARGTITALLHEPSLLV